MNDETTIDPLSITGDAPDASFPVLRAGVKRLLISSIEPAKYEGKGEKPPMEVVRIKLTTTEDDRDTEDNACYKGFSFSVNIFTTPNERNSKNSIREQLSMPIKAAFGREVAKTKTLNDCIGKLVDCKIGIRPAKEEFDASNTVKAWIVPV